MRNLAAEFTDVVLKYCRQGGQCKDLLVDTTYGRVKVSVKGDSQKHRARLTKIFEEQLKEAEQEKLVEEKKLKGQI